MRHFSLIVLIGSLTWTASAHADTWLEQAEADLACTSLADGPERASLDVPLLPRPVAAGTLTAYLRGEPGNARQAKFRHLTTLAAIGWWADLVNDQVLRSDVYLAIGVLADRYAAADPSDLAFPQVARCARANLISASLELGKPRDAELLADNLLRMYPAQPPARPVEDWPLILALRELRLEPRARNGIAALATRAVEYAGTHARTNQTHRASRLLAAAGQGLLAIGDPQKAMQLAAQSMGVTGKPPTPDAAWRAMPILYDAAEKLNGARDAASVQALLRTDQPPATLRDKRTEFEALLRLSKTAGGGEETTRPARTPHKPRSCSTSSTSCDTWVKRSIRYASSSTRVSRASRGRSSKVRSTRCCRIRRTSRAPLAGTSSCCWRPTSA